MKRIEKMAPGMISAMTEAVIGKVEMPTKKADDFRDDIVKRETDPDEPGGPDHILCVNCFEKEATLKNEYNESLCKDCNKEMGG